MRAIVAILALAVAASALTDAEQWTLFKQKFGKAYGHANEEGDRFQIFQSNLRAAEAVQAREKGASFGVTKFSDLTKTEFLRAWTGLNATTHKSFTSKLPLFQASNANALGTDWVKKGLVSSVKNQASCGSCWAFSAAAASEGCYSAKYGKTIDLSAAQITDCCQEDGSDGCNGGQEDACLEWAMQRDIATWSSYPYTGAQGTCKAVKEVGLKANTCTYHKVAEGEAAMKSALTHTTVAVAVAADILQYYTGGVVTEMCENTGLNHAVLLVSDEGAGSSFVVKNSWAADWGESGYFRLIQGKDCLGIADDTAIAY